MLDLKSLNTILFSNKESELKIAIKKISDQFEPEKAKNILAYAKTYNSNLLTEVDKLSKIVSDEEIINQFYNSETISPFFGFSSFKHLEEAKKSISQVQINTVKKNYSKLEIKNKELANAKKSSNSSVAQKLEQEIGKLQAFLNNSPSQTALKILQHDIAKEQYVKSFKLSKLVADYIEENNTFHVGLKDHLIHKHAYDIIICLGGEVTQNQDIIAKLQNFLSDKGFLRTTKPLHDAFSDFYLPKNKQNITLKKWQELISKHGFDAMKLFAIADRIEAKKAQNTEMQYIAPENLQDAIFIQTQLTYAKANEYSELAELALKYKLSEESFNRCLEIEKQKKNFDNLPNITIHGKDLDCKLESGTSLNGYHLVKLPINDPRAYILGDIVKDCQSIGGNSERCVIDGITRENNGFYVLLKNKNSAKQNAEIFTSDGKIDYQNFDIVGQAYGWLSNSGNLVLDSWENLRNEDEATKALNDDETIIPILQEFAKQVCNTTNIDRVVVGLGGKTPKKFKELEIKFPEIILEGFSYGDAKEQALIWQKPELTELENKINGYITKTEYKFELNRIDRAKALLDLIENEPNFSDFLNNSNHNLLKLLNLSAVSTDLKNFNYEYFKEFSNLNLNIIKRLVDDNRALEGYSKKFFTLEKLKDLPLDKIKILTQRHKFNSYEQNIFNFNDFKGLNTKKIKALRGEEAVNGYSKEYFIFDELKNLDTALIKMLVSDEARSGYLDKYFTFDDLKNLDIDLIKVLTDRNNFINKGYEKQLFTFNDLKVLNIDTLKILTSSNILEGYEKQLFTFNDLKVLSSDKLKIATSPNIIDCYQLNYFKFKDFVELDVEKMQAIYDNIRGCQRVLSEEHCTFNDLKNVDPNKIKALTESIVILGYKSKYFTFNGLKDISLEKIQTLTSKEALIKYGSKDLKFEDFKASLEIADDHKTEMSEVSSFTDLVINNHEENVDIIGRDL